MDEVLRGWQRKGVLPALEGRQVVDLGCGFGDFSVAFARLGASEVMALDVNIQKERLSAEALAHPAVRFVEATSADLGRILQPGARPVLFLHLMTEHVDEPRSFFRELARNVPAGTELFVHHDNYYQPVGHHDHGFLALDPGTGAVRPQGVACWDHAQKCRVSDEHRAQLAAERPWQWSPASEATRDPAHCDRCSYYRRSIPWAHLIYEAERREVWPEAFFSDALNAISAYELRKVVTDAGFKVTAEEKTWVMNEPPASLADRYGRETLVTFTVTLAALRA